MNQGQDLNQHMRSASKQSFLPSLNSSPTPQRLSRFGSDLMTDGEFEEAEEEQRIEDIY